MTSGRARSASRALLASSGLTSASRRPSTISNLVLTALIDIAICRPDFAVSFDGLTVCLSIQVGNAPESHPVRRWADLLGPFKRVAELTALAWILALGSLFKGDFCDEQKEDGQQQ